MKSFFSYSHRDTGVADELFAALPLPLETWLDRRELRPGQSIEVIETAIAECDLFLVLLTDSAIVSEWVLREINVAMDCARKGGRPLVIPILWGLSPSNLPSVLQDRVAIHFPAGPLAEDARSSAVASIVGAVVDRLFEMDPVGGISDEEVEQLSVQAVLESRNKQEMGYLAGSAIRAIQMTYKSIYFATVYEEPERAEVPPWVLDCAETTAKHIQRSRLDLLGANRRYQLDLERAFVVGYVCASVGRSLEWNIPAARRLKTMDIIDGAHAIQDEVKAGSLPPGWTVASDLGAFLVNRLLAKLAVTREQHGMLVYAAYNGALYAFAEERRLCALKRF